MDSSIRLKADRQRVSPEAGFPEQAERREGAKVEHRTLCHSAVSGEQWNSVRVTLNVPKHAADRLRRLAEAGDSSLKNLGILSVRVDGDTAVPVSNTDPVIAVIVQPVPVVLNGTSHHSSDEDSESAARLSVSVPTVAAPDAAPTRTDQSDMTPDSCFNDGETRDTDFHKSPDPPPPHLQPAAASLASANENRCNSVRDGSQASAEPAVSTSEPSHQPHLPQSPVATAATAVPAPQISQSDMTPDFEEMSVTGCKLTAEPSVVQQEPVSSLAFDQRRNHIAEYDNTVPVETVVRPVVRCDSRCDDKEDRSASGSPPAARNSVAYGDHNYISVIDGEESSGWSGSSSRMQQNHSSINRTVSRSHSSQDSSSDGASNGTSDESEERIAIRNHRIEQNHSDLNNLRPNKRRKRSNSSTSASSENSESPSAATRAAESGCCPDGSISSNSNSNSGVVSRPAVDSPPSSQQRSSSSVCSTSGSGVDSGPGLRNSCKFPLMNGHT